jgi:hypothetical protein
MTLGIWEPLIADDAHEQAKANVHRAIDMGIEDYGVTLGELMHNLVISPQMQAFMSGLVVGAIAFDVQAGCDIELEETGGFVLKIMVEQA